MIIMYNKIYKCFILEKRRTPNMICEKKNYENPIMEVYSVFEKDILTDSEMPIYGANEAEIIFQ